MKKFKKTLLLATLTTLITFSQANATLEKNSIDNIVKKIWDTEQNIELSKEDKISNLAWSSNEYISLTIAYDEKDEDPINKLTKKIWSL
ncbi:hypothetical protein IKB17_03545 [bacterium]|nr:hypothetical protein [bacterium]